jgi:hypothetical protein
MSVEGRKLVVSVENDEAVAHYVLVNKTVQLRGGKTQDVKYLQRPVASLSEEQVDLPAHIVREQPRGGLSLESQVEVTLEAVKHLGLDVPEAAKVVAGLHVRAGGQGREQRAQIAESIVSAINAKPAE